MSQETQPERGIALGRAALKTVLVIGLLLTVAVGPAAAQQCSGQQSCQTQLQDQMEQVGNFLSVVIAAVAVPNGAFGVFQWMTAGTDTEQSDKGRKRIRNSFIGIAGAGVVTIAVQALGFFVQNA